MASDHAELLAYLTSIDSKVERVAENVQAICTALNSKVDQRYCVDRCQRRWVPRSYIAATGLVGGVMVTVAALAGDLLELGTKMGLGGK